MPINFHTCQIEISKSAYKHNLDFLRKTLNDGVKISSVVKGNAYGHSVELFVPLAEEMGINHFSVFSTDEAYVVQKASKKNSEIMIMGYVEDKQLEWAVENDISFYVFDLPRLHQAISFAKKSGKKARIHIEAETGMHRTGFDVNEWQEVAETLKTNSERFNFRRLMYTLCRSRRNCQLLQNQTATAKFQKGEKLF
jgi:alanine racemase